MEDYRKFKQVLEYYVSHLDYVANNKKENPNANLTTPGYEKYIKPLQNKGQFVFTGQGYNDGTIQTLIQDFDTFNGQKICINVGGGYLLFKATTYLNWKTTAININANWSNDNKIVISLEQNRVIPRDDEDDKFKKDHNEKICNPKTISELGLFDEKEPNQCLKDFYKTYYNAFLENKKGESVMSKIQEYTKILKNRKNVILQGAPGTGKTYNTAALALLIIAEKEPDAIEGLDFTDPTKHQDVMDRYHEYCDLQQIEFCTFHQSMDYEDFVEGLKPELVANNTAVTYQIHEGIFRNICEKASSDESNRVDNFDESWNKLVDDLNDKDYIEVPLLSNKKNMHIELNEYGNGLCERTYPNNEYKKDEWINGYSKFFNKDQLYNIYQGLPGVPTGGHDNYRKAIVAFMKTNYGLKEYSAGTSKKEPKTNYVLIIDEINRGNISKIFGELITLLEKDKRTGATHPISVTLPYSQKPFSVPSNLYIIGTMNTTDRSTGTIDYAIRRRFDFITLEADPEVLSSSIPESKEIFLDVKKFIGDKKLEDIDIADLMVGHSYFMADNQENLKYQIQYEVIPLIKEYIKDGILNCLPSEANEYFNSWKQLETYNPNADQTDNQDGITEPKN